MAHPYCWCANMFACESSYFKDFSLSHDIQLEVKSDVEPEVLQGPFLLEAAEATRTLKGTFNLQGQ